MSYQLRDYQQKAVDVAVQYLKGYSSHKSRMVLVNGIAFDSVRDAANHIGCTGSAVSWAIKNNKQCKGFKVEFKK